MRIVYSTEKGLINRIDANNPELKTALAGSEVSKHQSKETVWDFKDEQRANVDIIETYVPIRTGRGNVIGAFEIYSDVTDYLSRANRNMVIIWLLMSILIFSVFGVLLLLMYFTTRAVSAGTPKTASGWSKKQSGWRTPRSTMPCSTTRARTTFPTRETTTRSSTP